MTDSTTLSFDFATLRKGYESGAFTPEEIIEEVYRRISAHGKRPVWISLVEKNDALAKAKTANRGRLYGLPFAVKDNIDVANMPTTCACPDFAYVPDQSATVVKHLEAAGAILIGKTNLDQFATGLVGTRSPYGIPSNVFDDRYISGGSSSGSAVAVAAGQVAFALGTDTAGSGRVPAAFNNIVGLKPTKGRISTCGVVPACRTQDTVSIFALTVDDAACAMAVADVFDPGDSYARQPTRSYALKAPPSDLRIGIPHAGLEFFGDRAAEKLFGEAVERAASKLKAKIVEIDFSPFSDAARLLYAGGWVAERLAAVQKFADNQPGSIEPTVRSIIIGARRLNAVETFKQFYQLADLCRQAEAQWSNMDAMLLPTTGTIYKIADVMDDPLTLNTNLGAYTNFVNLMDLAAVAVPAGFRRSGLPFGVTILGRAFDDGAVAGIANALHRALPEAKLGATQVALAQTPVSSPAPAQDHIDIAVVGAHLTGQPLNKQLTDRHARLIRTTRTASGYKLVSLANTQPAKPGLLYDGESAGLIEVEVWNMPVAAFGSFVSLIPPPLGIGTIRLENGELIKSFICEAHAAERAEDITSHGGWRAWLDSRTNSA